MTVIKRKIIILLALTGYIISFAQNNSSQKNICEELLRFDFKEAFKQIELLNNPSQKSAYSGLSQILFNSGTQRIEDSIAAFEATPKNSNLREESIHSLTKAYYNFFYHKKSKQNIISVNEAIQKAEELNDKCIIKLSILIFLNLYARESSMPADSFKYYIEKYNSLTEREIEKAWSIFYDNLFESRSILNRDFEYEKTANRSIQFFSKHKESLSIALKSSYYEIIGTYFRINNDLERAEYYLNETIQLPKYPYLQISKFNAYMDLGEISIKNLSYKNAEKHFYNAEESIIFADSLFSLSTFYRFKAIYYYKPLGQFKEAYKNLIRANSLKRRLNYQNNSLRVSELQVKLEVSKKEKQVLKNRNIAYTLGGTLLFGSIIFFMLQKNTKRKQLLAEQEKELQVQKVGSLMKEQELVSIDAMIAGQEKERQRIANDLHDDLGGMMATVKLHFNTLKDKPSSELYSKTDKLLDEAYQKVRSIAHAKNSGVIAKHGLLRSIKDMAQKVSATGKIVIDVVDHGLDNRLENSLELTIFRIVQELTTNVIKHAHASEMTIHLTQHDSSLNVMVEDNGKGFNQKKIKKKSGMGLHSIDKRIDHLNGTLNIESETEKGTTIIIDIPI